MLHSSCKYTSTVSLSSMYEGKIDLFIKYFIVTLICCLVIYLCFVVFFNL